MSPNRCPIPASADTPADVPPAITRPRRAGCFFSLSGTGCVAAAVSSAVCSLMAAVSVRLGGAGSNWLRQALPDFVDGEAIQLGELLLARRFPRLA